jgi:hypothetical protein
MCICVSYLSEDIRIQGITFLVPVACGRVGRVAATSTCAVADRLSVFLYCYRDTYPSVLISKEVSTSIGAERELAAETTEVSSGARGDPSRDSLVTYDVIHVPTAY